MRIGHVQLGEGAPLVLISGLNVIESERAALDCALQLRELASRHDFPLVFKASFDKANRLSRDSYRGPGLDEGLRVLARVKEETNLPILTDVHEPGQAKLVAEVADGLQIPAFLSRQTDLAAACAATGRALNIKKAQFMAPGDLEHTVEKARSYGANDVMLTERGTSFGYQDLVVDFRAFERLRAIAPLCFDATHAAQLPGAGDRSSGGDRSAVAPLARAAVAVGVDALFVEVHPDPSAAPCDADCQIVLEDLDRLLGQVRSIANTLPLAGVNA
jgi:2-dehydro-3-deoxyphosphooctonate aldolase (KDO 8-P synthase)